MQVMAREIRSIALGLALLGAAAAASALERAFDAALIGDFQADPRACNPKPARGSMPCVVENDKAIHKSFQTVRDPWILPIRSCFTTRPSSLQGIRSMAIAR